MGQADEARGPRSLRAHLHDAREVELVDTRGPRRAAHVRAVSARTASEAGSFSTSTGRSTPRGNVVLAEDDAVDFEDMLVQAADQLETGEVDCGYDLIMVDEFQDASRARARLVRGLLQRPGRYLLGRRRRLAVHQPVRGRRPLGDDRLPRVVRQRASAPANDHVPLHADHLRRREFVRVQEPKTSSRSGCAQLTVQESQYASSGPDDNNRALADYLHELSARVSSGDICPGAGGQITVDVLGRYRFQQDVLPRSLPANLNVTFRTVHRSKGLEADFVVLPSVAPGDYGFPSSIADDPVLDLAMPATGRVRACRGAARSSTWRSLVPASA